MSEKVYRSNERSSSENRRPRKRTKGTDLGCNELNEAYLMVHRRTHRDGKRGWLTGPIRTHSNLQGLPEPLSNIRIAHETHSAGGKSRLPFDLV